jgi:CubicO group peptidase (beta-lactamase class C family)
VVTAQLADHHVAGATVSVVKDGRLLVAKGYGHADVERGTPMDGDRTLVRVGSLSKLLTWTAVMQLAEQGRVDLDADVNTYLTDLQVPRTYPEPITLAHLMTHTAGFENGLLWLLVPPGTERLPLGRSLADHMPRRVHPPGTVTAYSNYGTALAGHVVERVAGMPFEEYAEREILRPLGMARSSFRQPPPAHLVADAAVSYAYHGGQHEAAAPEEQQIVPAGALSATAADMARFMLAHLDDGRVGDARLLRPETVQDMHRQHFANDPRVSGMTYGFRELRLNGRRMVMHTGTLQRERFQSTLVLMPEERLGLFVSYTGGSRLLGERLLQATLDRYYPAAEATPPQLPSENRYDALVGNYRGTARVHSTIDKVAELFEPQVGVLAGGDGTLVTTGMGPAPRRWVATAPLVFREVGGQETLVFKRDGRGRVDTMLIGNLPIMAFTRLGWYEDVGLHFALLGGGLVGALSAVVVWPIGALVGLIRRRATRPSSRVPGVGRWVAGLSGALFQLSSTALVVALVEETAGVSPALMAAMAGASAAAVLAVGSVACLGPVWRTGSWGLLGRLHYTLVVLALVALTWELSFWNVIGFRV